MPIEKRWVVKPQGDPATAAMLAAALRISPVLANLLVQRGIDTVEKAEKFFKPNLADLHDPFLMKDMEKAVERVERAVANNEKIMVYGDYDVDGCTAVALVYKFLRQIGHKNLMFYIPDRYTEGYGISIKGIDLAARKGVGLIIALDCGIKATEKVVYAKTKGVDFIICDHHLPAEEIPKAVAVLDPKRVDCSYPFDELSGCGVGFKLVQAYAQKNRIPFEQIVPLLDLLVVSIASDIVPLVGENRILAYFGLKYLNREPSKGLLSIIKICGLDKHNITIDDIVFKIGPRINAAGRMRMDENDENASPSGGHAAVELLIEGNESIAEEFGSVIDAYNQDRKSIDRSVTQEAHDFIERNPAMKALKSTVIYNPRCRGVHPAVQRLCRGEHRPADARAAGGHRQRTAVLGHHADVPQGPEPFPAVRTGQHGSGIRHMRREQPRRRQARRRGVRTPAHGPDAAPEAQYEDSGHRLPATHALRMGALGTSGRRLLPDRREPLPGHGDHPAPHQGHQAGAEPVISAKSKKGRGSTPPFLFTPGSATRRRPSPKGACAIRPAPRKYGIARSWD